MNGAQTHLAFNHLPVIGMPLAALLLAFAMRRKSRELLAASFAAMVLISLGTFVAFKAGGPAAHLIINIPGISRAQIHAHAEAGETLMSGTAVVGGLAVAGLWLLRAGATPPAAISALVLAGAVLVSAWSGWTAHLGGLIRHPEIEASFVAPPPPAAPKGGAGPSTAGRRRGSKPLSPAGKTAKSRN